METVEFEVNGRQYRAQIMSAEKQFHVLRKLGPVLSNLGGAFSTSEKSNPFALFGPVSSALSSLPEADADFVLHSCLNSVSLKQDKVWAKIRSTGGMQFDDIRLPEMLVIAWRVLEANFSDFFTDLVRAFGAADPSESS